jgi:hypothetical protein
LLELDASDTAHGDSARIPDGSTVMDLPLNMLDTNQEKTGLTPPGGMPIKKPAKPAVDNAQAAAAALFAKLKQKR